MNDIIKGDTLTLEYSLDDYLSTTYDIWVALRGPAAIDLKSGTSGVTITKPDGGFKIVVTAATTAGWTIGTYTFAVYAGKTSWAERHEVYKGNVVIKDNIATLTAGYDGRSHVKKCLDAIEAVIENRATLDQMSYTIAGRSIVKLSIDDLLKFRDYYNNLYGLELKRERAANDETSGNFVKVKF